MFDTRLAYAQFASNLQVNYQKSTNTHGMRNEMHIRMKWLRKPAQFSHIVLARDQKYLCLMKIGKQ